MSVRPRTLNFLLIIASLWNNGRSILEPDFIYKKDEQTTQKELLKYTWKRPGGDKNSSRCGVAIATDAVDSSPLFRVPVCNPPSKRNIFIDVRVSLVFNENPEVNESNWTVLITFNLDPNGLSDVNGFWIYYESHDRVHPLYGETSVRFLSGPLEPQDFNKLKRVALKEPYRPNDIFDLTICPMPFCGKVGSYCHNMTINIPKRLTLAETKKLPILTKKEDKCSQIIPTVSSKKLISYKITEYEDDYYHNLRSHHVKKSKATVDSKIITFIPNTDIDRTFVTVSNSFGEVITRYECPVKYYFEAATIVYQFGQPGLDREPYLLKNCRKIENENSSKPKLTILLIVFGLLALITILGIIAFFAVRKMFVAWRGQKTHHLPDLSMIQFKKDSNSKLFFGGYVEQNWEENESSDTPTTSENSSYPSPANLNGQKLFPFDDHGMKGGEKISIKVQVDTKDALTQTQDSEGMDDEIMDMPNQTPNNFSPYNSTINTTNVTTGLDGPIEMDKKAPVNKSANKTLDFTNVTEDSNNSTRSENIADDSMRGPQPQPSMNPPDEQNTIDVSCVSNADHDTSNNGYQKSAPVNESAVKEMNSSTVSSGYDNSSALILNASANNTTYNVDNCTMDESSREMPEYDKNNVSAHQHPLSTSNLQDSSDA
ncbi:uncharacterized protein LOC142337271 isoform X2 [Convolutriloba macropyga]|uniref:uncharacterized protein LOC142337271 isoform X2 n=1 Tax=Convolutriloba macropyga TaxID=536237 RepID=UPI003F524FBE